MIVSGPELPEGISSFAWPEVMRIAEQAPEKEAVVTVQARLNYEELTGTIFQSQRLLAHRGLKHGDRVAVILGNDWPYLVLYWAALASGIIFVPLNTRLARPELAPILDEVAPSLLIVDERFCGQVPAEWGERMVTIEDWIPQMQRMSQERHIPYPVSPDDEAVILYTSGTTGSPKGVTLTHRNIAVQFYQATRALVGMRSTDRIISLYPIFHAAQHVFLQAPLTIGATVIIDEFHPQHVLPLIGDEQITVFFGVPAMYHILLQNRAFCAENLRHIRLLTYGASTMPQETIQTLKQRFPHAEIRNLYGQTENRGAVTGLDDKYALSKPGSVGRPLPGMTVAIVDDDDQLVEFGVVGEVVTQGINLMKGYYKNTMATDEVVRRGWYHTGDLGYMDEEGFLYIVDRKKDMIIRGGQNIYPAEVENVLHMHPDIVECAVIGEPHPIYGEEVAAIIVARTGSTLTCDSLRSFCHGRIAQYKIPVHVHFVDELPHNASGKILKRELRDLSRRGVL